MKRLSLALTLLELLQVAGHAQDTSCGIIWYPPMQISPGISGVDESIPSLAVQGDTVHITWAFTSQKFPYRRSVDGGQSFEPVRELAPDTMNTIAWGKIVASPTHVTGFWVEYPQRRAWMIQSTDGGSTWMSMHSVTDSIGGFLFVATYQDSVLLGTPRDGDYRRIYRSTNAGATWAPTLPRIIGNDPQIAMTPGAVHRVTYWIFDSSGVWSEFVVQYRKSTDLGDTWSDSVNLSTMSSRAYEPAIAADGSGDSATVLTAWKDEKYGCLTLVGCSILGRRSMTTGNSFLEEQRFDPSPSGYNTRVAVSGTTLATVWKDDLPNGPSYIRVSFDQGMTWCEPYAATVGRVDAVAISGNTIHIAWTEQIGGPSGRRRVFYRRGVLLPTSVPEREGEIPPFVTLAQNYPNPFNPTTVIRYSLSVNSYLTLKVYDVLGREVAVLVNETMTVGEHTVELHAENLPSGLYFYRLYGGGRVETKKAILLK